VARSASRWTPRSARVGARRGCTRRRRIRRCQVSGEGREATAFVCPGVTAAASGTDRGSGHRRLLPHPPIRWTRGGPKGILEPTPRLEYLCAEGQAEVLRLYQALLVPAPRGKSLAGGIERRLDTFVFLDRGILRHRRRLQLFLELRRDSISDLAVKLGDRTADAVSHELGKEGRERASPVCNAWRIVIPYLRRNAQCDRALKARRRPAAGLEPSRAPDRSACRPGGDRSGSRTHRPKRGVGAQLTAVRPVKARGPVAICGPPRTLWIRCRANGNGDDSALPMGRR